MADRVTVESRNEDAEAMYEAENDSTLQLDPETIDGDFKYRFVYNNPNRLARLRMRGYDFVTKDHDERLRFDLVGSYDSQGNLCVGDSVLMRCPKKRYDRRRKDIQAITEVRMGEGASAKAIEDIKDVEQQSGIKSKIITSPGGTTV